MKRQQNPFAFNSATVHIRNENLYLNMLQHLIRCLVYTPTYIHIYVYVIYMYTKHLIKCRNIFK